jgi:hypothetical protein
MPTCKDARELQQKIAKNRDAMIKTLTEIEIGLDDDDADFVLSEIKDLISQSNGLAQMVRMAKEKKFLLTPES